MNRPSFILSSLWLYLEEKSMGKFNLRTFHSQEPPPSPLFQKGFCRQKTLLSRTIQHSKPLLMCSHVSVLIRMYSLLCKPVTYCHSNWVDFIFVIAGDFGDRYFGTDGSANWSDGEDQEQSSCWQTGQSVRLWRRRKAIGWKCLLFYMFLFWRWSTRVLFYSFGFTVCTFVSYSKIDIRATNRYDHIVLSGDGDW